MKKVNKTKRAKSGTKKIKALCLFSGGLDSIVATRMMKALGFDVELLYFNSPIYNCFGKEGRFTPEETARKMGLKLTIMHKGIDYIETIRNAKHGYGTGMNPCVDCRIYILKKAKEYAKYTGADFIFTGEVLGERPLSQTKQALEIIERESGLVGKIVRPLSGRLLPTTEAEKKGWIKKKDMLSISGRDRKIQINMAKKWGLEFPSPAGGCILTEKQYGMRLKDLFKHVRDVDLRDLTLLSIGRHFRLNGSKIIVGRRETENMVLKQLKRPEDALFECDEGVMGPITLLQGNKTDKAINIAARLTAHFSDAKKGGMKRVKVNFWLEKPEESEPKKKMPAPSSLDIDKESKNGLIWIGQNGDLK